MRGVAGVAERFDTGWLTPTGAQSGVINTNGNSHWSNPGNATVSDDSRAIANVAAGQTSKFLEVFIPAALPRRAKRTGTECKVEAQAAVANSLFLARAISENALLGGSQGDGHSLNLGSDTEHVFGSPDTLWHGAWDVNDSQSGVAVRYQNDEFFVGGEIRVDFVSLKHHYVLPAVVDVRPWRIGGKLTVLEIDFLTDGAGEARVRLPYAGIIDRIETVPAAGDPPDANWDVQLLDALGVDLLGGLLLNRSAADPQKVHVYRSSGAAVGYERVALRDRPELVITNAGADKAGKVAVYLFLCGAPSGVEPAVA